MKFTKALLNFKQQIEMEYGPSKEVIKIAVTPELYDQIIFEAHNVMKYQAHFTSPSAIAGFNFYGIEIVPKKKGSF